MADRPLARWTPNTPPALRRPRGGGVEDIALRSGLSASLAWFSADRRVGGAGGIREMPWSELAFARPWAGIQAVPLCARPQRLWLGTTPCTGSSFASELARAICRKTAKVH